jgi:hypothetical protein
VCAITASLSSQTTFGRRALRPQGHEVPVRRATGCRTRLAQGGGGVDGLREAMVEAMVEARRTVSR